MGRNDNRSALLRQWELLKMIPSRGEGITSAQMTEKLNQSGFEIGKRQVERDLVSLSEVFPIELNDDKSVHYWKWIEGASIDLPSLAVTDALSLQLVEETLRPLLPTSMVRGLEVRFREAEKILAVMSKDNLKARLASKVRVVSPSLPLIPPVVDPKILETVQDALLADLQVDVVYENRQRISKNIRLHPLALVARGATTYLIATAREYDEVRLYALHRIREASRTTYPVKHPSDFDLDAYIQKGNAHFGNGKSIRLVAWIQDELARILEETPLAEDQELIEEDGATKLTATVQDSWQLSWWIMSYGDSIEVVSPAPYRKKISKLLASAAAQYDEPEE